VSFVEREDVLASKLNMSVGSVVHKEVNQIVNSTAAFANDDDILWDVVAGAVYAMKAYIIYETSDVPDIKFGWSVPAGASLSWNGLGFSGASVHLNFGNESASGPVVYGGSVVGTPRVARLTGYLTMGDSDGRLQFRWAQNVNDAADTGVYAGSFGILKRIA
jgi:hypothetical protein